jgi:hypothetical protein
MLVEPAEIGIGPGRGYVIETFYELGKPGVIASIVTIAALVKPKSSKQTNRTLRGDMYMIRRYLLDLLANAPGNTEFDFRVARAINM